jgi:hypothetical protein
MGLLDDAIREHLDLKRRRGADPTEIERAEREALGPVRRGPEVTGEEPAGEELSGAEPSGDQPAAPAPAVEPETADPPPASEPWDRFQEDPEFHALEEDEELAPYEPARAPDGDPLMDEEPLPGGRHEDLPHDPADLGPAPEPDTPPAPHPADPPPVRHDERSSHVDQETEEYELEPEADDDVLESTPEFLQDAPEHDRLWFEQRPPRDFDFDG